MVDGIYPDIPTLLVFADDWGRHPSSCQHLVGHLLDRYQVLWVNTIGTRRPQVDFATLSRGLEKLFQWLSPLKKMDRQSGRLQVHPHLVVLNPKMWPSFGSPIERRINRVLLSRQLTRVLARLSTPAIAVTNIPIVADLVGHLPVRRWVYYCVDDFAEWPGLDSIALREMERLLVERADVLVAVSNALQVKLECIGTPVHLLTHGVDLEHWQKGDKLHSHISWLGALDPPLIVFWGGVDRRMDVAFLTRLADDLERGTIVLVGPEQDPDPALASLPRVVRQPPVPFEVLPAIAQAADVLVMPYADLPVTRAMQPLKLKEYLATDKPVVVRDLPSTRPWADCLDLVDSPETFSQIVRTRLLSGLSAAQGVARARLAGEGWAAKALAFERWLTDSDSPPTMDSSR